MRAVLCYIPSGLAGKLVRLNDKGGILDMSIPTSSQSPAVDARQVLDMNYAFAQTAVLIAAVHLHLNTTPAENLLKRNS
jgi:hypothetical protein